MGVWIDKGKVILSKRWITIHPHGKGTVGKYGNSDYRRIKIDEAGNIIGGSIPKSLHGKNIREAWRKSGTPHPHLSRHLTERNVAHEMKLIPDTGHHGYIIGEGVKEDTDKWGRPTAARGSVKFQTPQKMHFDGGKSDWVHVYSNFDDKDKLKSMGARYDGDARKWYIPVKDIPNVAHAFKHATITSKAAQAYEEALGSSPPLPGKQTTEIKTQAAAEPVKFESKYVPTWNGKMPDDMSHMNLYEHQKAGVEFLLHNKKAVLGYAVGLGKTPTAITAANIAIDEGKVKRFAVVAPSSVKFQWKSEVEKFSGRKAVVLDGSTAKRLEQSFEQAKDADFVITNYEMLRNPEYAAKVKELAGEAVIADEGHKIKNNSQQTKAWKDTFKDAKYRWLLTATPFPNGQPQETHTMLSHVAPDKVGSWSQFARDHAVMQGVNTPRGRIMKPVALKNQAALREKMKDAVMLRHHDSPDVNSSMPSARHVTHSIDMTKDQAKVYNAMSEDLMHELEGMDDAKFKENAANILTKMKRLEQIAVDPDQLDPENADMKKLYPKEQWAVDTTIDHLENADNRGMVIFSDAKLPLEKVKAGLIANGLKPSEIGVISGDITPEKRTEAAKLFGEGKIKVILSTAAGEEGVNLQHGGHTMIHLDTPWVPKSITQREGRVLRTGQPSAHTMFYSPTMSGTVEGAKRAKLAGKVGDIEKLLGAGAAGSAAENIAASAKAWSKKDMLEMLAATPKGVVKKSVRSELPALNKSATAGDHWVTIKQGHLKGRKILLDSKGYIVGGSVPEAFQGHHIGKLKGIGTDANPYTDFAHHALRAIHKDFKEAHESNKRELHEMRHGMAQQLHAAHLDQYGSPSSIANRIKQIGGIKAPVRGKDAYAEEYLESVPASMRRVVGSNSGVAIDEAADELGMSASELIDALSSTEHKGKLSATHFYPEADRMLDHLHGEKHMQSKRDSVREMDHEIAKVEAAMRRVKRTKKATKSMRIIVQRDTPLQKALSTPLKNKLAAGGAHWVTVKEGPLKGRHLLIDGPRPAGGRQSRGKILAGHGIPPHVIEKITGATHAHHVDHEVSNGPKDDLSAKRKEREDKHARHAKALEYGLRDTKRRLEQLDSYGEKLSEFQQERIDRIRAAIKMGDAIMAGKKDPTDQELRSVTNTLDGAGPALQAMIEGAEKRKWETDKDDEAVKRPSSSNSASASSDWKNKELEARRVRRGAELERYKSKLDHIEGKIEAMNRKRGGDSHLDRLHAQFPLGRVGGSGNKRNINRLNERKNRDIERTVSEAVAWKKLYEESEVLRSKINYIESGKADREDAHREISKPEYVKEMESKQKADDTSPLSVAEHKSASKLIQDAQKLKEQQEHLVQLYREHASQWFDKGDEEYRKKDIQEGQRAISSLKDVIQNPSNKLKYENAMKELRRWKKKMNDSFYGQNSYEKQIEMIDHLKEKKNKQVTKSVIQNGRLLIKRIAR